MEDTLIAVYSDISLYINKYGSQMQTKPGYQSYG